jgi:hypothetical protein
MRGSTGAIAVAGRAITVAFVLTFAFSLSFVKVVSIVLELASRFGGDFRDLESGVPLKTFMCVHLHEFSER